MEARLQEPVVTTERNTKTEKLLAEVKDMIRLAEEKAVERAKAADKTIRSHPYQSLGVAFAVALGIGLAIGFYARRSK
jgi:ElaB/YqjD/DUF883 family membrane-anchored ribosome-binding protein